MKAEILSNIDNPRQLEQLYRQNASAFKHQFNLLYPELKDHPLARFWKERLNYEGEEVHWGSARDTSFVLIAAVLAGFIAKLPVFFHLDEAAFYQRNIGFIIFPFLILYFAWKNRVTTSSVLFLIAALLVSVFYINVLPSFPQSDSLLLACLHLPLFLWCLLGFAYSEGSLKNHPKRLGFLRYNGDLAVMTAILVLAGVLLTGVTIGLFSLIGWNIEEFYIENVVVFAAAALPLAGTYLTQTNPQLVNKVSPVIAKLFSPLVLVTLLAYLAAILISGKDPYNDREFLLTFNALLVGVMAIILFSVAGTSLPARNRPEAFILFGLSLVTILVNGIALSAIVFRISEWGFTPNRVAVLGGNLLILANLILVTVKLFGVLRRKSDPAAVGMAIAGFLPVYAAWAFVVTFLLPLVFRFA
ncbi:MAG TPA: hypothetical protein VHK69_13995 [Chitinophagaceae bacterium]|nr:hypothetical protein [Chitinophagaceae bacterium]